MVKMGGVGWRQTSYIGCIGYMERRKGGRFQGVQGATVLHCLARLYKIAIRGATKRNRGGTFSGKAQAEVQSAKLRRDIGSRYAESGLRR